MFKVIWEKGNLVRLIESADEKIELNAPRIVYQRNMRINLYESIISSI